jgi:radical SAM protein with 4Fe4S-binding SPASM domain
MTGNYGYDLVNSSFAEGWRLAMPAIRTKKASADVKCSVCEKRLLCGRCPAFSALENGAEEVPSAYLCALGRLRWEKIIDAPDTGRQDGR